MLVACSSDQGHSSSDGNSGSSSLPPTAGTGGNLVSGGGISGGSTSGGSASGGSASGGSASGGSASGGSASGGSASGGSASGGSNAGGTAGGGAAGGVNQGGGGGMGGTGSAAFTCSEAVGGKLVGELFAAGFETFVDDARWQVRWKEYAEVQQWANPQSDFWKAPLDSACASGSSAPERVLFMIFSWSLKAQADWTKNIKQTVDNFKAKYPSVRRLELMTQVVAPGNQECPTPPAAGETITVSPELQAALTEVLAAYPGYVYLAPRVEARTCSDLQGGGPHLNMQGNAAAAKKLAEYLSPGQ